MKPSQDVIWASIGFLSALSAKALYCQTTQGYCLGAEVEATQAIASLTVNIIDHVALSHH